MKEEKLKIIKKLYSIAIGELVGDRMNIEEYTNRIKREVNKVKEIYPDYTEITFEGEYEYGYYNDSSYKVYFYGVREETDEEYNKRMEEHEKRKESAIKAAITLKKKKAEEELSLYQKLKAKFEK